MNYKINIDVYRNIFGVPCDVADKHVKLASHSALKVLLFFMRNGLEAIDSDTPRRLAITEAELNEALIYWNQVGVLTAEKAEATSTVDAPSPTVNVAERNKRPDRAEVARRIAESEEIAHVLRQAESVFGRTLKPAEMASLIYIMDSLSLKASITLMLVQYAAAEGRLSPSFIESTAVRWANEGISSVRDAEKELQAADQRRGAWQVVCRAMGIDHRRPSQKEEESAARWVNEWAFSDAMLRLAYDQCVDHTGKFSMQYINTILDNWHKNGVYTPKKFKDNEAVLSKQSKAPQKAKKKAPDASDSPSFDISLFEQLLNEQKGD